MSVKFPWFLLANAAVTGLSLFGLYWYENLTGEEKARIDGLAAEYAQKLYGRMLGELTDGQRAAVNALVRHASENGGQ
jgi:hypothetical protein